MTQTERTRFIILFILLIILVVAGVVASRFQRKGKVGADILGTIQNQAVATFSSADGLDLTTLSDISQVTVSSGVANLAANYNLGKRDDQNAKFEIQFYDSQSGQLVADLKNQSGQTGILKVQAKNVPNGTYDISFKPCNFLSQSKKGVTYLNGQVTTIDFPNPFKWGDIRGKTDPCGDNVVNNIDWAPLIASFTTFNQLADYNGDGVTNNIDAAVMLGSWGAPGEQFQADLQASPSPLPEAPAQ